MPVVLIAASRPSGRALVSPVTIPGSNPAASGSSGDDSTRKCSRAAAAKPSTSKADPSAFGAVAALRTASSAAPERASFTIPVVRTDWPGRAFRHASPPTTMSDAGPRTTWPWDTTEMSSARTVQRPAPDPSGAGAGSGAAVTRNWTSTLSPSSAADDNGP